MHFLAHGARVEIMNDEKPRRVVDEPFMGGAVGRLDFTWIRRIGELRQSGIEFVVFLLTEIETIGREIGGRKVARHDADVRR
jgi:hypothetical protein